MTRAGNRAIVRVPKNKKETQVTNETVAYAVQPRSWENLDPWGADYVPDLDLARSVAKLWGEPCTVWLCHSNRPAYPLLWA